MHLFISTNFCPKNGKCVTNFRTDFGESDTNFCRAAEGGPTLEINLFRAAEGGPEEIFGPPKAARSKK